ncbi:hypothetical protein WJX75_005960 [Coccomyxa subellipsoidea]|uniref:Uncharacterized protein n=1 Tax=Coccomyxa subellipsoidea TaxID=248742 RepID=A0ABR2YRZ1_9CHLO
MPEPEPENVDPKPNPGALEDTKSDVKDQRAVSWLDGVDGKSLFTVREFEPSESGLTDDGDEMWQKRRTCCTLM